MSKTLRTLAAAALIAVGLPQMASAALVTRTLDFTGVTTATLPNFYNGAADTLHGHTEFTGGNGAIAQIAGHGANSGDPDGALTNVLYNGCLSSCANTSINFTVHDGFEGTFDFWMKKTGGTGVLNIIATTTSGQNITQTLGGDGASTWQHIFVTLDSGVEYASVQFTVAPLAFFFDDISFQTDDATTPPGVPEPASVALVALALVGAASATRRRKS
ncbi:PEP-CTERM sorting domain-containing protein [Aquabacterium sp.]|uniref:PEP-CTERM sorting domain-containing protein n=1 Tax=Aquabacterium sp. TaxID=1872578 RepID=UPI002BD7A706|nr:PEP-CTERM sorting domain-containing protein [Aquabacterium sp.]HSW06208.1 PEP-CTERM sorting domain-containing protein [Aquabacterium sp.]